MATQRSRLFTVALLATALLGTAACGSDKDAASSSAIGTQTGDVAEQARAAGEAAGKAEGAAVELPDVKIGILDVSGSSEADQRLVQVFEDMTPKLGWEMSRCDAQGDTTKMVNCMNSLLGQNVDVIFTLVIEPSVIASGLAEAKQRGIPVINFGGATAPGEGEVAPQFAGSYYQNSEVMSTMLTDQMKKDLPNDATIAAHTFSGLDTLKVRFETLKEQVAGTDMKIVDDHQTDFANPIVDTKQAAVNQLTAHQGLDAFWFATDFNGAPIADAITTVNPSKTPMVYGFFANPSTIELIRSGQQTAAVEPYIELYSYVALDQAAELLARKKEPARSPQPDYPLKGMYDPIVITKDNVPSGNLPVPSVDFASFFQAKWKTEFIDFK